VEGDSNPRLTDEEKSALSRAVCDALQKGAKFTEVLSWVARACPHIAGQRTLKQLVAAYECLNRQVSSNMCNFSSFFDQIEVVERLVSSDSSGGPHDERRLHSRGPLARVRVLAHAEPRPWRGICAQCRNRRESRHSHAAFSIHAQVGGGGEVFQPERQIQREGELSNPFLLGSDSVEEIRPEETSGEELLCDAG
jgi:hypothetical protein